MGALYSQRYTRGEISTADLHLAVVMQPPQSMGMNEPLVSQIFPVFLK